MDSRTEAQKMAAVIAPSERRTIGGPVDDAVLVIAPTHAQAQEWARQHGVSFSKTIFVGPNSDVNKLQGRHGTRHVILSWHAFDVMARAEIRGLLVAISSEPYEDDHDVSDLRS